MSTTTTAPDLAAVKTRQQQTWASGDFAVIASRIVLVSELLADNADLRAGWRVLDVACGNGNATLAAARSGTSVVGVDYVPELLEGGRARAVAEGLDVEMQFGDAEALPFADASFDAALSVFGAMFAPDHRRAAAEILRVVRPGGTVGLASWTPDGFIGQMFGVTTSHVPGPAGVQSPLLWGTEQHIAEIFGDPPPTTSGRSSALARSGSPRRRRSSRISGVGTDRLCRRSTPWTRPDRRRWPATSLRSHAPTTPTATAAASPSAPPTSRPSSRSADLSGGLSCIPT